MGQGGQSKSLSSSKRPVALLDVDHTLFFGIIGGDENELQLNANLLESLKQKDILDVYLFTDMTLSAHSMKERDFLMELLRNKYGMAVHGVLTPCDVAWAQMDTEEVALLETLTSKQGPYQGRFWGEEFEQFVCSQSFKHLPSALRIYSPPLNYPGIAFQESWQQLRECQGDADVDLRGIATRSMFAKAFADHLSHKFDLEHSKALLLDLFIHHLPPWVDSIIVCDDNEKVNRSITSFRILAPQSEETKRPLPETDKSVSKLNLTISMIHVTSQHIEKKVYLQRLEDHLRSASRRLM